jgi:hypothetical protein
VTPPLLRSLLLLDRITVVEQQTIADPPRLGRLSAGQVEIFGPDGEMTAHNGAEIADFRTALDAAITQAEADVQRRQATGNCGSGTA